MQLCTTPSLPRRLLIAWNLLLMALVSVPAVAATSKKLNIVMILVVCHASVAFLIATCIGF